MFRSLQTYVYDYAAMSFTSFIPVACKTFRRSARLMRKEKDDHKYKKVEVGLLGYFELLPTEILYRIFSVLTIEELSLLTICSKELRNRVDTFRNSPLGLRKLIPRPFPESLFSPISTSLLQVQNVKYFQQLGLLMKRSTCLYPTKERMRIVLEFINKLQCNPQRCGDCMTNILQCYGKFVRTVIAGWDESECYFVHSILEGVSHMKKHSKYVLGAMPGAHPKDEMYVRQYYRYVYLDYCWNFNERCFWLTRILKPWPFVYQAKLLYLLYGPTYSERIQWYELIENVPTSAAEANRNLNELANAIRMLRQNSYEWNEDDVVSLLEELTDTPEEWLTENVSTLLLLCGDIVAVMLMGNKLLNGKMMELANLVVYLAMACTKYGYHLKWLVQLIDTICESTKSECDRQKFIQMIPSAFREALMDLHDISDLEDEETDLRILAGTQNSFLSVIINRAFSKSTSSPCRTAPEE